MYARQRCFRLDVVVARRRGGRFVLFSIGQRLSGRMGLRICPGE